MTQLPSPLSSGYLPVNGLEMYYEIHRFIEAGQAAMKDGSQARPAAAAAWSRSGKAPRSRSSCWHWPEATAQAEGVPC